MNRPLDEPTQLRVRAEAAAVLEVIESVARGEYSLISSGVIEWELGKNPYSNKQIEIRKFLTLASNFVDLNESIMMRAKELTALGFRAYDALHLASAEEFSVNCFLTSDDKFLKLAA